MGRGVSNAQQGHSCHNHAHMIPVLLDGRIRDRLEERRDIYKDQQQKGLVQQYRRTLQHLSVVASIIMAKDKFQIQVIVILKSKFWSRILF